MTAAREVVTGIDGVETYYVNGTRSTFTLEDGARLDQDELAEAFTAKSMRLESIETERRAQPVTAWYLAVEGVS